MEDLLLEDEFLEDIGEATITGDQDKLRVTLGEPLEPMVDMRHAPTRHPLPSLPAPMVSAGPPPAKPAGVNVGTATESRATVAETQQAAAQSLRPPPLPPLWGSPSAPRLGSFRACKMPSRQRASAAAPTRLPGARAAALTASC